MGVLEIVFVLMYIAVALASWRVLGIANDPADGLHFSPSARVIISALWFPVIIFTITDIAISPDNGDS